MSEIKEVVERVARAIGPRLRVNILQGAACSHKEIDDLINWIALLAVDGGPGVRIRELERALEPFADRARYGDEHCPDEYDNAEVGVSVGDLRRARDVLDSARAKDAPIA